MSESGLAVLFISWLGRVSGLLGLEVAVVVVLHVLGDRRHLQVDWDDLSGWMHTAPTEDVIGAVLRVIALGLGYWLLFSTLAYVIASASRHATAIKATSLLTLPPIRRFVGRSVALSIAASSIAVPLAPAVASPVVGPPGAVVVEVDADGVTLRPRSDPAPDRSVPEEEGAEDEIGLPPHLRAPADSEMDDDPSVDPETDPSPATDHLSAHVHTVIKGDHLWSIAQQHLQALSGRLDLGEHEIAQYWLQVIEVNLPTIRSGDPDLIYPGERIVLPSVTA